MTLHNVIAKQDQVCISFVSYAFLDKNEKNNLASHWGRDEESILVSKICNTKDLIVDCESDIIECNKRQLVAMKKSC